MNWLRNLWGRKALEVASIYHRHFDATDPEIKIILTDLAEYCQFGRTSFVPGDPYQTAFNEGARDAFLHILEMASIDAAAIPAIRKEIDHGKDN